MKRLVILLTLLLIFPAAFAGDQCRHINGHAFLTGFQETCEFDSIEYDACYITKIRGSINGSWVSYVQRDWGFALEDLGVPTPPDAGLSFYNREFEVFTSKQGTVWGDSQFVFDLRAVDSGGGTAIPTMVTGGTGIYEDAQGWITATGTDSDFSKFSVRGRVCGPNIESD